MTQTNDGGPAFPSDRFSELGMSLRDWFAGQALAGLLSDPEINYTYDVFATASYRLADAMLAERAKERE